MPPKKPARAAAKKAAPSKAQRHMQVRLAEESWKALRMLSIETGRPTQGLALEAFSDLMRKHGKNVEITGPDTDE
ncbi:hypothetical protein IVB16_27450 [Bradyrhizobium sp. 183]|uniref:ribbon-helix-helix domain-containing protein n=1 Tax=unclassified Bradyrhizobium TaxID=2631580 RepID=UPI0020001644|nr:MULTISPECIES: ribbon-helix-helix domain-containing protein [unclassified Bradyrhizobium]UPJ78587.1 hypothetical protein IVB17_27450 [Bradyrhizobium sp. 184]UPJ86382.1 hypothetical protein IVB16_27450 [Bradyrhizobium sp. 183]